MNGRWAAVRLLRALVACAMLCIAAAPSGRTTPWSETVVLVDRAAFAATPLADDEQRVREDTDRTVAAPASTSCARAESPGSATREAGGRIVRKAYLRNCALLL